VRPNCGTATSIHIQDPDTNNLELPWYLQTTPTRWRMASAAPKSRAAWW
jgi:hypothetical protein